MPTNQGDREELLDLSDLNDIWWSIIISVTRQYFSLWWTAVLEKIEMNDKNLTTSNSNNIVITSIYRYRDTKKTLLDI